MTRRSGCLYSGSSRYYSLLAGNSRAEAALRSNRSGPERTGQLSERLAPSAKLVVPFDFAGEAAGRRLAIYGLGRIEV